SIVMVSLVSYDTIGKGRQPPATASPTRRASRTAETAAPFTRPDLSTRRRGARGAPTQPGKESERGAKAKGMKPSEPDRAAYLADLDDPDDPHFYVGREYLRDVGARPAKRRRDEAFSTSSSPPAHAVPSRSRRASVAVASWWGDRVSSGLVGVQWEQRARALPLAVLASLLAGGLSIYLIWMRQSTTPTPLTDAHSANCVGSNPKKKRRKRKRKKNNKSSAIVCSEPRLLNEEGEKSNGDVSTMKKDRSPQPQVDHSTEKEVGNSNSNCIESHVKHDHTTKTEAPQGSSAMPEYSAKLNLREEQELCCKEVLIAAPSSNHDSIVEPQRSVMAITSTANHIPDSCMPSNSFEQIASRWEARGLDRQKSLELAAQFETNMFFFKSLASVMSSCIVEEMSRFSSRVQCQLEANHKELSGGPKMEKLRKYRGQAAYTLLNGRFVSRCLLVALVARYHHCLTDVYTIMRSPSSALGIVASKLCPECDAPITGQIAVETTSYLVSYLALESWRGLIHQTSHAITCAMRLFWGATCLGFCHRFIPSSLCYAILALVFVPWRDFVITSGIVVATNISLTLWMLRKCETAEINANKVLQKYDALEHIINNYALIIPKYKATAYVCSAVIGLYKALDVTKPLK
ncbi:hypothetical protein ACHAWF_004910, partial [Thalassiosira exigua]